MKFTTKGGRPALTVLYESIPTGNVNEFDALERRQSISVTFTVLLSLDFRTKSIGVARFHLLCQNLALLRHDKLATHMPTFLAE